MGLLAGKTLHLDLPRSDKMLLTIAETDGCTVDGISAATGCTVGHRTLRIEDYGKVAATFVDVRRKRAIRIVPRKSIRQQAYDFVPQQSSKWQAYLLGYQRMPDEQLFHVQEVALVVPVTRIISKAGKKVICQQCGEEIINEREVVSDGRTICRACSFDPYYRVKQEAQHVGMAGA
jgi:formylmethanofuran dehydrogenase subunit E